MPWLPLYINQSDLNILIFWLNNEVDIAFIVPDGPKRWKAVTAIETRHDSRYCLWHTASGGLPLLRKHLPDSEVSDPWKGWKEKCTGADPTCPYFGAGHPGIYWLNAKTQSPSAPGSLGLSSFEWIGNRYGMIGHPAPPVTMKWWRRLGRWVKKQAIQIPRAGPIAGQGAEIWAFPGAREDIESGKTRDSNP
ncbi:hypothetical protein ACFL27_27660 [candidate division CSSED10-310 bacterium]|uniref:Uncharacterized protein n=1 Tax=candidate division CSSED10-310 bacterium TaxID=2855610 RepID=A0ABV6Z6B2_UNCC1